MGCWGLGFRVRVWGLGFGVWGLGFRVQGRLYVRTRIHGTDHKAVALTVFRALINDSTYVWGSALLVCNGVKGDISLMMGNVSGKMLQTCPRL